MDWISIISLFFSLSLISSYYWNHIPDNHSRICTLLFRSWFSLGTFSSRGVLDEAVILHKLLETEIFGFRMPCAWISLDLEVPLEEYLFPSEPSLATATAFLDAVSGREPECVALLPPVVHWFFLLPNNIRVPVKKRENHPNSITWEHFSFSTLVLVILFPAKLLSVV